MNLLLLGGTSFVGRAMAEVALARGHTLTLFHRGKTGPDLFPEARHIHGDRTTDLGLLGGQHWDAVIDTSGYHPRHVAASAQALTGAVQRYVFISTISVYADFAQRGITEDAPLARFEAEPDSDAITGATYGPFKVQCEEAVQTAFPDGALIIRPGLIVGPHDPTDRFTYWVRRAAHPGPMLAPEGPDVPMQVIDVRDLATWTIDLVEAGATGIYNATGAPITLGAVLDAARASSSTPAEPVWVDAETLQAHGVAPWSDLPLWVPASDASTVGLTDVAIGRATAAGLQFRPLQQTVADTLAWDTARKPAPLKTGIAPEREQELLGALRGE